MSTEIISALFVALLAGKHKFIPSFSLEPRIKEDGHCQYARPKTQVYLYQQHVGPLENRKFHRDVRRAWMVPQTTRSDVKQLPEALHHQRHHFVTEYVWVDLFCSLQDDRHPEMLAITRHKIAQQVSIFSKPHTYITWLKQPHAC